MEWLMELRTEEVRMEWLMVLRMKEVRRMEWLMVLRTEGVTAPPLGCCDSSGLDPGAVTHHRPCPSLPTGPALTRSLSGEGGEAGLLRRQVELLQEEVTRLRLKGEEPIREGAGSRRRSNGDISDVMKGEPVSRRRGSRELEPRPLAPLATQEPVDQLDGVQETNGEKISPRSDSPRDLQDIPEESECGAEPS
ncbi:hypothetical protein F7725_017690 [Dissostichus mawsoni]|uniref:Uncharacterized protein n=1 Tax=Dissostichus mawsoni TaxID=36200 RepID=A0A7J5XQ50_DISMA|nr:hypothetical protein F7725_017690 [Dissostichus mawsoni]